MNFHSVWRSSTSTPAVGSSSTITGRPVHQRLRDQHAALHAARQRAHVGVGFVGEVEIGHDLVDPRVVVAQPEVAGLDAQGFAHGEERIEHEFLRHHAERAARGAEIGHDVVAAHRDAAFVGASEAGEDADERRLARAVRTEQSEELAFFDREADALERLQILVALLDVTNFYG